MVTCKIPDFPFFATAPVIYIAKQSLRQVGSQTARLSILVHVLVVAKIFTAGDIVQPGTVVKIPPDCLLDPFRELKAWLPSKLILQFGGINGIAHVMPFAIRHKGYQVIISTIRTAKQPVHSLDQNLDQVNVLPLVEASDVVSLGDPAFMEDQVYGTGMILDIKPVTYILPFSIDGKRPTLTNIIDKQWYKLSGNWYGP